MTEAFFNFFNDIAKMALQFGDRVESIMFKPDEAGKIVAKGQDPYGNLLIDWHSKIAIPEVTHGGCLGRLSHLTTALSVIGDKKLKAGTKIALETRMASDQKTTVVGSITFQNGRTKAQYVTKDPFRGKTGATTNRVKITEWPTQFEVDQDSMAAFDEAHKVHMSSGSGDKSDLILLIMEEDEIRVRFGEVGAIKSDPKTQTVLSRKITGESREYKLILPAATLRSTMRAMGPDGGIAKLSDKAISIKSESFHAVYTITLTGKTDDA